MGDECVIRHHVRFNGRSERSESIKLGIGVSIRDSTYMDAYGGYISLGNYVAIGHRCVIGGHGGLVVGDYTMIGGFTYIIPSDHVFDDASLPYQLQGERRRGISIGRNVWIGASCLILDGTTIGDDAVVGGGSVVKGRVPARTMYAGVPAREIRRLPHPTFA
jgi:acetyltransferase-like isoleucine patch superfamily enzyme